MAYNISYDICAIVILIMVIAVHLAKKSTPLLQNNIFLLLAFTAVIAAAVEILNVWADISKYPPALLSAICAVLFLLQNVCTLLYAYYARTLVENTWKSAGKLEKIILVAPVTVNVILIATTYVTKLVFYYDGEGIYHRGPLLYLVLAVNILYFLVCLYYMNIYKVAVGKGLIMVPIVSVVLELFASAWQMLHPECLLLNYVAAVSIVLFMLTIQKPEEALDSVMGVFNNKSFAKMFEVKKQMNCKYYILLLYVEDTKLLNQTLGLDNMNVTMRSIAAYLEEFEKRGVYYIGSNVFALMMENSSYKAVTEVMSKIDQRFESKWICQDVGIYITVRMMKLLIPHEVLELETFYTYVDYIKDLDNSKKWILAATDVSLKDNNRRIAVETAVREAIRNDGFEVYYQPIYSVKDRKINSAEALIRLTDSVLGSISPVEFIPIAEHNGTILKIGVIVFEKVCRFIQHNSLMEKGIEYIEINLSVVQCMQENMGDELLDIMKQYHVESSRINLEITETAAVSSPKMLIKNMHHLFENGVCFSLDDFGTGYSNIHSLMNLPLDMIKFDKVMVDSLLRADKGKILLVSSIAMVKRMNLKIVAEGVELREQAEELVQLGVDFLQGYFFERPVPEDQFIEYVDNFDAESFLGKENI